MNQDTATILVINPGSTSTKVAVFENLIEKAARTIRHSTEELSQYENIFEQKDFRLKLIVSMLDEVGVKLTDLDAVVGRCGPVKPIRSGTYQITEDLLTDINSGRFSPHASSLGAIISKELGNQLGIPSFVVDPVVVDEMQELARVTGLPEIQRQSIFHALNTKSVARKVANELGKAYTSCNLILVHIGGGISVGAHKKGQVIDVYDALNGDGPFAPTRAGGLPAVPLINLCFSGKYSQQELTQLITSKGGLAAHLGTGDMQEVEKMMNEGAELPKLIWEAMAYNIAKAVGAMGAVLRYKVDRVVITGGIAHSKEFVAEISKYVERVAPIVVFPGEDEMYALAEGALRVLTGEITALVY